MELLSVRRSGGNWRLFHRHVRRSPLHTAQPPGCTIPHSNSSTLPTLPTLLRAIYHSHLCLLSHSTLRAAAAFHQNFTPILTITQLVSVRSNHSESENHDRLLLIKLLRVRCKLQEREFEWIDKISFGTFPTMVSQRSSGFRWQLCETQRGPKICGKLLQLLRTCYFYQKSVGKLVKSAKTHPPHFLFTKSIVTISQNYPELFCAKSNEQPWEEFANCDLLQHWLLFWQKKLKTDANHSKLLLSISLLKFQTVCSKGAQQRNRIFTRRPPACGNWQGGVLVVVVVVVTTLW